MAFGFWLSVSVTLRPLFGWLLHMSVRGCVSDSLAAGTSFVCFIGGVLPFLDLLPVGDVLF